MVEDASDDQKSFGGFARDAEAELAMMSCIAGGLGDYLAIRARWRHGKFGEGVVASFPSGRVQEVVHAFGSKDGIWRIRSSWHFLGPEDVSEEILRAEFLARKTHPHDRVWFSLDFDSKILASVIYAGRSFHLEWGMPEHLPAIGEYLLQFCRSHGLAPSVVDLG
jgi:hypothetical protein